MYIESLVKRNTCGLLVPITANEARTLSDTPPVAHASSLTTYGLSASGIYGHVKPAESLPLSNSGIGSVGVAVSIFARADHRHPEITSAYMPIVISLVVWEAGDCTGGRVSR